MAGRVRAATVGDLGAMVEILIEASRDDPNYAYRFPHRPEYPDDFATRCRLKCVEYMTTNMTRVFEVPSNKPQAAPRVVAFCVWEQRRGPGRTPPVPSPFPTTNLAEKPALAPTIVPTHCIPQGRDAEPARLQAFHTQFAVAQREFFDHRYRRGYMFLKVLVCHPDYRRRGAGKALTRWGIWKARRDRVNAVLFSSPMGLLLYPQLGFQEIGKFTVHVPGEEKSLEVPVLVFVRQRHPRSRNARNKRQMDLMSESYQKSRRPAKRPSIRKSCEL